MTNEGAKVKKLKERLLALKCPHIDSNEDEAQIRSLLLEDSSDKKTLVKWMLEILTDSQEFGNVKETLQSFGLDLTTLPGWQLALDLIQSKEAHSNSGFDGLRQSRNYLDFLMASGLASPISQSNLKSNLIARDIEKDVLSRAKKSEDLDILAMKKEDLEVIRNTIVQDIQRKKSDLTAMKTEKDVDTTEINEKTIETMKKFARDFEQDFKPWTENSKVPLTDEKLEGIISRLNSSVCSIEKHLSSNLELRNSSIDISESLKAV